MKRRDFIYKVSVNTVGLSFLHSGIKAAIGEYREISHVTKNRRDFESVALGDKLILSQLAPRVVQNRHAGAGRGEHGALLASPRSQAQYPGPGQARKPGPRHGLRRSEENGPLSLPGSFYDFRFYGDRPRIPSSNLLVPRQGVVSAYVDIAYSLSRS